MKSISMGGSVLIIVFLLMEIVLRLLNITGRNEEELLIPIVRNSICYKDYAPGSTFVRKPEPVDEFDPVLNEINSIGIRGPELGMKTVSRVLNIGDSFVQAEEVEFDKTFGELLNQRLDGKMEFISHGISSWAPTPIFSWIHHKGIQLDLDEVNLFICINDFYRKDRYVGADGDYRDAANYDGDIPVSYSVPAENSLKSRVKKVIAGIELIRLPMLVKKRLDASAAAKRNSDGSAQDKDMKKRVEAEILERSVEEWPPDLRSSVDDTLGVIVNLNKYLAANGITLRVLIVPLGLAWEDEVPVQRERLGLADGATIGQTGFANYVLRVLRDESSILTYRLWEDFDRFKASNPGEPLFFRADGHWNERGHALVASILEGFVNEK